VRSWSPTARGTTGPWLGAVFHIDATARGPEPGERCGELPQGPLRHRGTKPPLQLLIEGNPGLHEDSLARWRQLQQRRPPVVRVRQPPTVAAGFDPVHQLARAAGGDPRRRALALAGDDPAAKKLVARLYNEFGFDAVDIGGLAESWRVDAGQPAFVTRQNIAELKANVAKAQRGA